MILRENINLIHASLIVEECLRNGADTFFLAPGARCAPLTLAVARHAEARVVTHFDERGLGFAALGYAKATGRPGVVVTTSGTAVSNLHPAVVEARMDQQPMLLLTADRPPELRDAGANQAIDQVRHFGEACVWFFDLPCPDTQTPPGMVLSTVDQALHRARRGPAHLNCMFREPLGPLPDRTDAEAYLMPLHAWMRGNHPFTAHDTAPRWMDELDVVELHETLSRHEKVLVIAGGGLTEAEALAVHQMATCRGWPVVSDIGSGLHFGPGREGVVRHVDALVSSEGFPESLAPDCILQFGPRFLSKRLMGALTTQSPDTWIQVTPREGRFDPVHRLTHRIRAKIDHCCLELDRAYGGASVAAAWLKSWLHADAEVEKQYAKHLDKAHTLTEPGVARAIARLMPNLHGLVLGASMPVRDVNQFAAQNPHRVHVTANRGASGIDGTLATASGFARGLNQRVTVLLGDLAALHDLNSLALIAREPVRVVVVVVNNHGGGIFNFLPMADNSRAFETYFNTPHEWGFEHVSAQFGLPYARPTSLPDFIETYREALEAPHSCLIEVETDREQNVEQHRALEEMLRIPAEQG